MRIELNKGKLSDTVQCLRNTDRCNSKYILSPFVSIIRHDDVSEGSNQFENNLRVKH